MIDVYLIGYTADLRHLVLDLDPDGEGRYRVVVDGDLIATLAEIRDRRLAEGLVWWDDDGMATTARPAGPTAAAAAADGHGGAAAAPTETETVPPVADEEATDGAGGPPADAAEPAAREAAEPAAGEAAEPAAGEAAEPAAGEAAEPVTEGAVEPAAGEAVEPALPRPVSVEAEPRLGPTHPAATSDQPRADHLAAMAADRPDEVEEVGGVPISSAVRVLPATPPGRTPSARVGGGGPAPARPRPGPGPRAEVGRAPQTTAPSGDGDRPPASAAPLRPPPPPTRARLSPAEIQALLRAGRSPRSVAAEAGTDVAWIERWLPPILEERARILAEAHATRLVRPRLGRSREPLGEAVRRALRDRHVDPETVTWDTHRRADGRWTVTVRYRHRGRTRRASWLFDPTDRSLEATSELARELGFARRRRR